MQSQIAFFFVVASALQLRALFTRLLQSAVCDISANDFNLTRGYY